MLGFRVAGAVLVAIVCAHSSACAGPPSTSDAAPSSDATDIDARDAAPSPDVGRAVDAPRPLDDAWIADDAVAIDAATDDASAISPDAAIAATDAGIDGWVAPPPDAWSPSDAGTDAFVGARDAGGDAYVPPPCSASVTPAETAAFASLMSYVNNQLASSHVPGASVAVVLRGCLAFAGAAGVRNVASGAPVTTSTIFRANSMSKMVLAAAAMSLVRDRLLDLSQPITRYVPWLTLAPGYDPTTITMQHLLTHSSGYPADTINQCVGAATRGTRDAWFMGNPQPLWFPPGAAFDYSNTGYSLASEVITGAAGIPNDQFEQLVHDRVFVPANMFTATYDDVAVTAMPDHATGYVLNASGAIVATREPDSLDCPLMHASGGVMATPTDYAHLVEQFLASGGDVTSPAAMADMEAPHVDMRAVPTAFYGYGLATQFSPYPTHRSVWHDGSAPGYHCYTWMIPDHQFAVIVMMNASLPTDVAQRIVGHALPLFIADAQMLQPLTTPSSSWAMYTGTYDDTLGTLGRGVVVALSGGVLSVNAPNSTPQPVSGAMTQLAIDTWQMPDGTGVTFFPDASGTFRYFVTRRGVASR